MRKKEINIAEEFDKAEKKIEELERKDSGEPEVMKNLSRDYLLQKTFLMIKDSVGVSLSWTAREAGNRKHEMIISPDGRSLELISTNLGFEVSLNEPAETEIVLKGARGHHRRSIKELREIKKEYEEEIGPIEQALEKLRKEKQINK